METGNENIAMRQLALNGFILLFQGRRGNQGPAGVPGARGPRVSRQPPFYV